MNHWLLDKIETARLEALKQASSVQIYKELFDMSPSIDESFIRRTAEALELAVLDLISERSVDDESRLKILKMLKEAAADAFRLFRILPRCENPIEDAMITLRMSSLAVLGEMGADAARLLREKWPALSLESDNWRDRTWSVILDVWLRLIRKQGWPDRDAILEHIAKLRISQKDFENKYLNTQEPLKAKSVALELICLYHLAKIAEIFAMFMTDGVVEGNYQIKQLLETHFDRIFAVCEQAQMLEIEPLARLLLACSLQMIENSIWTVTRAVNSRVTQFVRSLVDRGRGDKSIFDVLPPQRRALAEKGLLGSSRRAVVVSLPTSSGKTLIAQFRILQALNQFELERGWVAYLAPTKALVNQITRQLRRDFSALKVVVEQVSPALEVDNVEMGLLQTTDPASAFRVLVTTPEKLDLMLRQGWELKIGRPLTLVVVDEAHNIQSIHRGLKLELLLATINKECKWAQFLLLTPFIKNAREVARWLGGTNSDDISLSVDWQPNDRVIGIVQAEKGESLTGKKSFDYRIFLKTIHTTRKTLTVDEVLTLPKCKEIAKTFSNITNDQLALAAVTAQELQKRGPVIVMHQRPDWVWSLAEKFKITENKKDLLSENVKLVQQFLALEFGFDFPLIDLLGYGVGVHHAGLSDEVRSLMEWLFEKNELRFLVATTTISQGVNFPVSGVVMASHQYPYGEDMPPEDFWNIAGRAGRIGHGSLGVVALVANNLDKAEKIRVFINNKTGDLNSALIELAESAKDFDLGEIVYRTPEWSSFLQYLAHTYRQMGEPESFIDQIEQVLRGTLGFEKLRSQNPSIANKLLGGIHNYMEYLQKPGQPLKLVDSTGFSLQSIMTVLTNKGDINSSSWNSNTLFRSDNKILQNMMGVLLKVPELRENLGAATGGDSPDGKKLALIIKDWVNGVSVSEIATRYFMQKGDDQTKAMTKCGQNLFGKLTQTASWGLGALLSITGSGLPEEQLKILSNLPSRVYYGVNSDAAIVLRLLGVSREAALPLANVMGDVLSQPVTKIREQLKVMNDSDWNRALGEEKGKIYRKVWRILEGIE